MSLQRIERGNNSTRSAYVYRAPIHYTPLRRYKHQLIQYSATIKFTAAETIILNSPLKWKNTAVSKYNDHTSEVYRYRSSDQFSL